MPPGAWRVSHLSDSLPARVQAPVRQRGLGFRCCRRLANLCSRRWARWRPDCGYLCEVAHAGLEPEMGLELAGSTHRY